MQSNSASRGILSILIAEIVSVAGSVTAGAYFIYELLRVSAIFSGIAESYNLSSLTALNATYYNSTVMSRIVLPFARSMMPVLLNVLIIATLFGIAVMALQVVGWRRLEAYRRELFRWPYIGSYFGLFGILLTALPSIAILEAVMPYVVSGPSPGSPPSWLAALLLLAIPIMLGVLFMLIWIVTFQLGVWRIGSAFASPLAKASVVLFVIILIAGIALSGLLILKLSLEVIYELLLIAGLYVAYSHSRSQQPA
ncbi:MAG: hypothetical protein ACP5GH_06885 [Nitrososphaeria archaeon]